MLYKLFNIIVIFSILTIIGCGADNEFYIGESTFSLYSPAGFQDWSDDCQEQWYQLEQEEHKAKDEHNKKLDKASDKRIAKDKNVTTSLNAAEKRHKELMYINPHTAAEHAEMEQLEDKIRRLREKYADNQAEYDTF